MTKVLIWRRMFDPRLLGKLLLPVVLVTLLVSGGICALLLILVRPVALPPPFLDVLEATASAGTDSVSITVFNPQAKEVNIRNAVIQAVRDITYVSSVTVGKDPAPSFQVEYEKIKTIEEAPVSDIQVVHDVRWWTGDFIDCYGYCCTAVKSIQVFTGTVPWHTHPPPQEYKLVGDVIPVLDPYRSFVIDVTAPQSTACFEVKGIYESAVVVESYQKKTLEISLQKGQVSGCKINLTRGEYVVVSLYDARGKWLGQVLIPVVT